MQTALNPGIDRELVGQDGIMTDGGYMDQYLVVLNDILPLGEVLGSRRARILAGSQDTLTRLLSACPVKAFGTDNILSGILYASAMAGFWQPDMNQLIRLKHEGLIEGNNGDAGKDAIRKIMDEKKIDRYLGSAQMLRQNGLAFPTTCGGYLALVPSQKLVESFAGRR